MFREPGKRYQVAARYANEPVFLQKDQEPGPRGISIKVFGVEGTRLSSSNQSSTTQDFFFNNAPSIELTDINACLDIMQLREKYFDSPVKLAAATKLRTDAIKQSAPGMLPNTNIISHTFYSQSAFRFGKWYGHFGLIPVHDEMKERDTKVNSGDSREVLKEWLEQFFKEHSAKYEFKVRPCKHHWVLALGVNKHVIDHMNRSNSALRPSTILPKTAPWFGTKQPRLTKR